MEMQIDLKVAQLLCSRLCHDLVGSASAINAGLELIREDANDILGPLDLMGASASQMTNRLAFFRVAFGLAEGVKGAATVDDVRKFSIDLLKGGKVLLNWPDNGSHNGVRILPKEVSKVCMNLILTASECLPRGGELDIRMTEIPEGTGIAIEAKGEGARISEDAQNALIHRDNTDHLTVRNAHVYFAQSLALAAGGKIEHQVNPLGNAVQFAVLLPVC